MSILWTIGDFLEAFVIWWFLALALITGTCLAIYCIHLTANIVMGGVL